MRIPILENQTRVEALIYEGEIAKRVSPETRLRMIFELLELTDSLFTAANFDTEEKLDED